MELRGITLEQFVMATRYVSTSRYDSNIDVHQDARDVSSRSCRGRLVALNSRGAGARRSWSGRRGPWACWHAYRDVLTLLFERYSYATIRTSMATYKGWAGFHENYPATAYKNIGSEFQPAYMPDLCECDDTPAMVTHRGSSRNYVTSRGRTVPWSTVVAAAEHVMEVDVESGYDGKWTAPCPHGFDVEWQQDPWTLVCLPDCASHGGG